MPVNSNKPDRWKSDIAQSVDLYNDWFLEFAPEVYRRTRAETMKQSDLLGCDLPQDEVVKYPSLWKYLQMGVEIGVNERYLCKHRFPWYSQENRPPALFLCTYMGRQSTEKSRPFRFILNHSKATAANVYLMLYPKPILERVLKGNPELVKAVWQALNKISPEILIGEGRVYGGGLYKVEPKELANAPADTILAVLPGLFSKRVEQMALF